MPLVAILKMTKEPNSPMLDLLEVICEKSPKEERDKLPLSFYYFDSAYFIHISCLCHGSRHMSVLGFLLVDEVELQFDSPALREIISISGFVDELLMSALASRVSRQKRKMTKIDMYNWVVCTTRKSAEALATLIQNCEDSSLSILRIEGNIEALGWAALAKALSSASVSVSCLYASRELMREGEMKDLRTITKSLSESQGRWIPMD